MRAVRQRTRQDAHAQVLVRRGGRQVGACATRADRTGGRTTEEGWTVNAESSNRERRGYCPSLAFKVRGSRFTVRGPRFAVHGPWFRVNAPHHGNTPDVYMFGIRATCERFRYLSFVLPPVTCHVLFLLLSRIVHYDPPFGYTLVD